MIAISLQLQQRRTVSSTRPGHRFTGRLVNVKHVHTVDLHTRYPVGIGSCCNVLRGHRVPRRRCLGVLVVLASEYDRQIPDRRKVHRLVDHALTRGTIAEECHAYRFRFGSPVLRGERRANRQRNTSTDDCVCTQHPFGEVRNVHRTALSLALASVPAHDLCHHACSVQPLRYAMTMSAVRRPYPVLRSQMGANPRRYRFLPV